MKCAFCGRGNVIESVEKNHETTVAGVKMTFPEAIVGRCDTCKQVNFAFRKEVLNEGEHIVEDKTPDS
jgi:hypothetical protein